MIASNQIVVKLVIKQVSPVKAR